MDMKLAVVGILLSLLCLLTMSAGDTAATAEEQVDMGDPEKEKLDYAKGSLCGYCDYCKFCQLCDKDCPCEISASKPNCHMCKYCKFCYLCSAFCDTICQAGGILDKVSSAVVSALPSFNKQEVDEDLASVNEWIEKEKDEL